MPSIRWDRRALIVIIFGIVTAVLWILCIWQLVLRYKTETSSPSSLICGNKGEYKNGRCFCPEEWIGQRCEIVNFCENSIYQVNSSVKFTFTRIIVDRYGYSEEKCNKSTVNAGTPIASRKCSKIGGKPTLDDVKFVDCDTNLKMLKDQLSTPDKILSIANDTQILTSVPEKLTTENISIAADIAGQILKNYSQEATATVAAVATISQLLDARESEFNFADNNLTNITASLTQTLEKFSLNGSAVQPNIAVNHISLKPTTTTAFFSAQTVSGSLQSENIKVDENVSDLKTDNDTEVQILINVTRNSSSSGDGSIGFVLYQNDKFFQSKNYKTHFNHAKQIISGNVVDGTVVNDVKMVFNPKYDASEMLLHDYACVFWDYSANDWSTTGCTKEGNKTELRCRCNHTTGFAVLMSFKINYKYAKPLEIVSNIGSGFSIAGLVITILFQILTRKTRKFSVTWMLVSLCTSMLIFNIIFIFGIDNSNAKNNTAVSTNNTVLDSDRVDPPENALCTAVAVLLHYFLLATFMWTALNSAHLYLLLLKTLRPIPGHFTLIMSIIGWGVPAVVVAITLGATYREGKQLNYRQEEFCWLAVLDDKGEVSIKKPMIGAFLLVVAVILLFNIIIFVKITVFVMWKKDTNLTSNKKKSFTTKIFGTLSIAVVLGITWVLGYMMLINQEATNIVFSILFCIFNATQGLQICILYTFRSPIFKKKVTELFSYVSLPDIPISLHSKTYYLLKFRYKKHTYENFKPSETFSEETSFSSNDQTPTKN